MTTVESTAGLVACKFAIARAVLVLVASPVVDVVALATPIAVDELVAVPVTEATTLVTASTVESPTEPDETTTALAGVTAPAVPVTVASTDRFASASWVIIPNAENDDWEKAVRPKLISLPL
jgi:hypothetical protein